MSSIGRKMYQLPTSYLGTGRGRLLPMLQEEGEREMRSEIDDVT
jgi:hypothetical protein